jgi:hypothetical protein
MKSDYVGQERVGRGRRGRGRPRQWESERTTAEQRQRIEAWFSGRLPDDWFTGPATVVTDDEEILVVGKLSDVTMPADASAEARETADVARIGGFREDTREQRMRIADEAQAAFGRIVSWGAACGESTRHFTVASVPVMTRLRIAERGVLDTLIDAGVARSRSEALAWCVRLVGRNEEAWIADLRHAFDQVDEVRSRGPQSGQSSSKEG